MTAALATDNGTAAGSGGTTFTIPSQPLGAALEIYARISNREVLYDGALAAGRRSSEVDGVYTPQVALQILLAGTGLWADFKDTNFFVVGPASAEKPIGGSERQSPAHLRYYARLQASLRMAFCKNHVPDGKRVAARLWVGQWGQVLQVKTLMSSDTGKLDRNIETILYGLKLGDPPPAGFEQPITIVVLPDAHDVRTDCDSVQPGVRAGP
jgi:hypothetical protein